MPRTAALAIHEGRIVAVGEMAELDGLRGSSTHLVDLEGRTMKLGMIDPIVNTSSVQLGTFLTLGSLQTKHTKMLSQN